MKIMISGNILNNSSCIPLQNVCSTEQAVIRLMFRESTVFACFVMTSVVILHVQCK